MKKRVIALSVLCAAVSPAAAANEVGFYIGGHVGQASKEVPRALFEDVNVLLQEISVFIPAEQQTTLDDTDIAFAIIGGYRLNRYLAFESSYTKLGRVTYESRATGAFPMENGSLHTTIETETSGFTISVIGTLPLTRNWELFARGGTLFATNRLRIVLNAQGDQFIPPLGNRAADSFSRSSNDPYASLGISRRILEIYDLRLEYQRVFDAGLESTGGKGDIDAAMLGLTVTF